MSLVQLGCVFVYVTVIFLCLAAAYAASKNPASRHWVRGWIFCSVSFSALVLVRLFDLEDRIHESARDRWKAAGQYQQRADLQIPLVVLTLSLCAVLALVVLRLWMSSRPDRYGRLVAAAYCAILGFLPLLALRMISWHMTDQVLYGKPVHLNWAFDFSLSIIAGGSALLFVRLCRRGQRRQLRR